MRNSELSKQVKNLRTSKGLSQEELSDKSGLSLRTIQRLENAESHPRGDTLKMLTNALELPHNYFDKNNSKESDNKIYLIKRIVPWYIIGFSIIGLSIGIILGLTLILLNIIPREENITGILLAAISVLIGAIGLIIGNIFEKKHNK